MTGKVPKHLHGVLHKPQLSGACLPDIYALRNTMTWLSSHSLRISICLQPQSTCSDFLHIQQCLWTIKHPLSLQKACLPNLWLSWSWWHLAKCLFAFWPPHIWDVLQGNRLVNWSFFIVEFLCIFNRWNRVRICSNDAVDCSKESVSLLHL